MGKQASLRFTNTYKKYRMVTHKKRKVLVFFRDFMPEMIYRTTKLEEKSVTRKMIFPNKGETYL